MTMTTTPSSSSSAIAQDWLRRYSEFLPPSVATPETYKAAGEIVVGHFFWESYSSTDDLTN